MLWITPLRALTNDIKKAMQEVCDEIGIPWKIATRTGDTPAAEKAAFKEKTARGAAYHTRKPAPDACTKRISQSIQRPAGSGD